MSMYIVTGNYTAKAMAGMIANPSDRAEAVKPMIEAGGGTMISYLATTGEYDFSMVCETDDIEGMLASLMVAGGTGTVSNMRTVQAFSSAEFMAAQKRAGVLASKFKAAG